MWTPAAQLDAGVFPWMVEEYTPSEWEALVEVLNSREEVG